MSADMTPKNNLKLLECTLRDGSYAVDFRFTLQDTAFLTRLLSRLGLEFIEIGHGFGIGASDSGKGKMPASDIQMLETAKLHAGKAKIGMFCIPGIATLDGLQAMASGGMDFVRIGNNAETVEQAYPFLEAARKAGLLTMLNFMKSYAITPKELAQKSKEAVQAGAEVIYIVDSAGGMLPDEVASYAQEIKSVVNVEVGFHGHNNLQLATANAIAAVKCGATYIDTTLYGLGRSAGNVPTEIMIAIANNMGMSTGVDLFALMDAAEKHLAPLISRLQMYDMLSVVMGASKFHSSFYPLVERTANEFNADIRKLVFAMGKKNPSTMDNNDLVKTAKELTKTESIEEGYDLTSFYSPKIRADLISNTMRSVVELMEGLINVSAKGRRRIVVEIAPTQEQDDSMILAEYVTADQDMVLGRIRIGSEALLTKVLQTIKGYVTYFLIDTDTTALWTTTADFYELARSNSSEDAVIFYSSQAIHHAFILDNLLYCKNRSNVKSLLIVGAGNQALPVILSVEKIFDNIYFYELPESGVSGVGTRELPSNCQVLGVPVDWKNLNIDIGIVAFLPAVLIPASALTNIMRGIKPDTYIMYCESAMKDRLELATSRQDIKLMYLDLSLAYVGALGRWMKVLDIQRPTQRREDYVP